MNAKKHSILVVDDAPSNIDVLKNILVQWNYQVKVATSGELALKIARKEPQPDLIMLDIIMPEMDGYECCQLLKANPLTANIPVLFVTGAADDDEILKGLTLGAAGYIFKPLDVDTVIETVKSKIDGTRRPTMLERVTDREA